MIKIGIYKCVFHLVLVSTKGTYVYECRNIHVHKEKETNGNTKSKSKSQNKLIDVENNRIKKIYDYERNKKMN